MGFAYRFHRASEYRDLRKKKKESYYHDITGSDQTDILYYRSGNNKRFVELSSKSPGRRGNCTFKRSMSVPSSICLDEKVVSHCCMSGKDMEQSADLDYSTQFRGSPLINLAKCQL
ncbi:hypothetical protein PtA15_10A508 [Puccinia triticina]|uniref:Uncharacterized protein n=1 Tax=Puccinia triticina TaxID=208348 RepID=A0ABY7CWQ5_9BASI|nr:uncharacterized protein PtA15_10A508 [Puccinia triticina]WAQ89085.1 hypothetical protein PtA15_10A508 [Puccinia triticina]